MSMGLPESEPVDLSSTTYKLRIQVQALDADDRPLPAAQVLVDREGAALGSYGVDDKARLNLLVDIGGLYGVSVVCDGYLKKRFVLDSRCDDPSRILSGEFGAQVNLNPADKFGSVETDMFEMPYAMIIYSKADKAFIVDPEYLRQMQQLEAGLMLKAARQRKKGR
jgi:hypothetical protein